MKKESNKVSNVNHLLTKIEYASLNGHIQETHKKIEGNTDARSDYGEHSALQCDPLQGQACFRCLCLLGHCTENSTAFGNNHPRCQAGMAVNATPELFSLRGDTINKLKV
jgi:hypothetical protein